MSPLLRGLLVVAALVASSLPARAQSAIPGDSAANARALPPIGTRLRLPSPDLERSEHLLGRFGGIAADSAGPVLVLQRERGTLTIPCPLLHHVEQETAPSTGAGRKGLNLLLGAAIGAVIGDMAGREYSRQRDELGNVVTPGADRGRVAGALMGTVASLLFNKDGEHWRDASLPGCTSIR